MTRLLRGITALLGSVRGTAFLEFGLSLPLFLGFVLTGLETANYVLANNRVQRLSAMVADLVAQSGAGSVGATERQIYDLFEAIDLTAKPFDLRRDGRIYITAVRGTDANNDRVVENRILWQRVDGQYVAAAAVLGCAQNTVFATLPENRLLSLDEILFHAQVTYEYEPIFSRVPFEWLDLPTAFTRVAMFRARSTSFQSPSSVNGFPPKRNCNTADGL
ncbi:TadE/TadG family type IV pilus assembly protein [Sphingomonas japonica]|uniref:TadE-like protein n=1 Tax=Sphingomonas japonica TaxID=511662 RepID=A0ABX0U4H2_9SPHN|nr:pilus assembly protein [Sphingomonas japonica]NIJ24561.1 hypothetical protein [Sphingomonas japonica]